MKRSDLILQERQINAKLVNYCQQLEKAVTEQSALSEQLMSYACAWAWNMGRGVPDLTYEQRKDIVEGKDPFALVTPAELFAIPAELLETK